MYNGVRLWDGILKLTICYSMSCSNGGRHTWVGGGRKSHVALRCCWKGNVLLLTPVKASRKTGHWLTINLVAMIEVIRAHSLNRLLRQWWLLIWTWHHQKLSRRRLVYELEVLLSYQEILDPKGIQTFERGKNKKNKGFYEGGRWKCAL
jgi:hypothetical protein